MKAWLGTAAKYWENWNRVYRNQVSYGDDAFEDDFALPINGTELQVKYWTSEEFVNFDKSLRIWKEAYEEHLNTSHLRWIKRARARRAVVRARAERDRSVYICLTMPLHREAFGW